MQEIRLKLDFLKEELQQRGIEPLRMGLIQDIKML